MLILSEMLSINSAIDHLNFLMKQILEMFYEVNLFGMVNVIKAFLPLMREYQEVNADSLCQVINMSSIAGRQGYPFFTAYNTSKFKVKGLSEALRLELISSNIDVSVIEPVAMSTAIWGKSEQAFSELKKQLDNSGDTHYLKALEKSAHLLNKAQSKVVSPKIIAELVYKIFNSKEPKGSYLIGPDSTPVGVATKFISEKIQNRGILKELGFD